MIILRISGTICRQMIADLLRPHAFAGERIGFLFVRSAPLPDRHVLLLGAEYTSVPDEDYIEDMTVGARINGTAIRRAMQKVLDTQQGCFHVHVHEHKGKPRFSRTDGRELRTLIPCFQKVAPSEVHGALLLSDDSATCIALLPDRATYEDQVRITLLDLPMRIV